MRWLLPLMMLSGSTAFVAPVAPARPQHVVRAEKEGEAVAKKKGIPLALLIWPLIAVGDDIYVSQVQPRLAEQGIETPALPYSNTNYLKK
mmetsp:Transcript_12920/g.37707  ORF Transcript_12920/g.37707 Transcript_12920/m.37707 type:complete len:90 (+) Transcript_12920:114-383(+)